MKKILLLMLLPVNLLAQNIPFKSFKDYPFTKNLCASAQGEKIAWTVDLEGGRNVYAATGPDFKPVKLTNFSKDDGQEITSLSITDDGKWVVFVRGGDHGGNYDDNREVNPAASPQPFKVQIGAVPFIGGKVKFLSEGDMPSVSSKKHLVAFIKDKQAWVASLDALPVAKKLQPAKNLFTTRGEVSSLMWSPDEKSLLFVTNRGDHSIIGIYNYLAKTIKWVAPSFNQDANPCWSADGSKIVFARMPGSGGAPDSLMKNNPTPWGIYIADVSTGKTTLLWKAPATLRGSFPDTGEDTNLYWAADNTVVFLSYHDGWPHLYSIPAAGGTALALTPGSFMVEHVVLSADKRSLTFGVNTGNDAQDIDRRHAAKVSVDKADMQVITQGAGLEWVPVLTGDGRILAMISATAQRPPLPAVMELKNNPKANLQVLGMNLIPADFLMNKYVTPKQVIYQSPDGLTIHAQLFEPADGAPKHPAIIFVHGGPQRQMLLGWHYFDYYGNTYSCNQYLASLGFCVLSVNYRLGIGYGYEFNHPEHAGPAGEAEYQDIKAAGEWLKKQTFVDSTKIGIYGGSYGGYLTATALAHDSKLFAAGVDIHGVHDWIAWNGLLNYNNKYEKAPDFEKAVQTAWLSSPVSAVSTWRSPVLIIHADDDRNVPFNQSVDLIRRLDKQGVPYETLMIVDDTHHWMSFDNSVKVFSAVGDFFVQQFKK